MISVSKIQCITNMSRNGASNAEIARTLEISEPTVRKYLNKTDFSPKVPCKRGRKSKSQEYDPIIESYLLSDRKVWKKQRHTAKRIYDRLVEEHGCTLSESAIRYRVHDIKERLKIEQDQFLKLVWHPGEAQVDFGETDVFLGGIQTRVHYLTLSFPYSNVGLAQIFLGETSECVCQGLLDMFEYIGGVPSRLVFDNATGVGRRVVDKVQTTRLFTDFALHFGFEFTFCNPDSGHEKGNVENKVGTLRRNLFVPVPRIFNLEHYNKTLLDKSYMRSSEKAHYLKGQSEEALFMEDKFALLELPTNAFDVVRYEKIKCDKYGKVCLQGRHHYLISPAQARKTITVGLKAHTVAFYDDDAVYLCEHPRSYSSAPSYSEEPSSTLGLLCEKPGGWQNSSVRETFQDDLRAYIDEQSRQDKRETLKCLRDVSSQFGYEIALSALHIAYEEQGEINRSCVEVCAARAASGFASVTYDEQVDLGIYDVVFGGGE